MLDKLLGQFDQADLPLLGTDLIGVSRDGVFTKKVQLSDLLAWTGPVQAASEAARDIAITKRNEAVNAALAAGEFHDAIVLLAEQVELDAGTAANAATNAVAARDLAQIYAAALAGTSTTSITPGLGPKVFTTQAGKQWPAGSRLRIASPDGSIYVSGIRGDYVGTSLTLDVDDYQGAINADWTIGITGTKGETGDTGIQGHNTGLLWNFDVSTTTASNPGTGDIRLNNASLASVTEIGIADTCGEAGNPDASAWVATWDSSTNASNKGLLLLQKRGAEQTYAIYRVTARNDQTGYTRLTVAHVASSGAFADTNPLSVTFVQTGDKGADGAGTGDVSGPGSSIDGHAVLFDGATGKLLKSAGAAALLATALSTDGAFAANSDLLVPSQKAVRTYALPLSYLSTDGTLSANSDTKVASEKATKAYIDSLALNLGRRQRVRVKSTGNVSIATALNPGDVLNGVTLQGGDLVLLNDQTTQSQNGVYDVGAVPARNSQFDTWAEFPGSLITVGEGTVDADTVWLCTANDGGTLGATAISFSKTSATGALLAANNLSDLANADAALNSLGGTTVGKALFKLINPSAVSWPRFNADNTVTARTASELRTDLALVPGTNIFTQRTITGGGGIAVANGDGVGGNPVLSISNLKTLWVPAAAMQEDTTNPGATAGFVASGTAAPPIAHWALDPSATESLVFSVALPKSWDRSDLYWECIWSHGATTTNFGVFLELQAVAIGDNEAMNSAYGTGAGISDTGGTTNNQYRTALSGAMTVAGSPSVGDTVYFRLNRLPSNGADTLAVDARIIGARVFYRVTTLDDA